MLFLMGISKHFYSLILLPRVDLLLGLLNENQGAQHLRALAALKEDLGLVPSSLQPFVHPVLDLMSSSERYGPEDLWQLPPQPLLCPMALSLLQTTWLSLTQCPA